MSQFKRCLLKSLTLAALLSSALCSYTYATDSFTLPTITGISIDGSESDANFTLGLGSNSLTTQQVLDLSLTFKPDTNDVGGNGSVYVIFVKNGSFFLLNSESHFSVWNGDVATLFPFSEGTALNDQISLDLLSGRLNDAGEFQVFIGYDTGNIATLKYTPSPFVFTIDAAEESALAAEALSLYTSEVEDDLIQTRCIACHVTGGLARNSDLQFQRTMAGSELNNLNSLQSYLTISGNSAQTLLDTASGGNSHPGGQQITGEDELYQSLSGVLELLEQDQEQSSGVLAYTFDPVDPEELATGTQTLLSSVILEPREATYRRASILFTGEAPTPEILQIIRDGDDDTLRESIRSLMSTPEFSDFLVRASNDRLLIEGSEDNPLNEAFGNHKQLRTLAYETLLNEGRDVWREMSFSITTAALQSANELIAHVVSNDLPYSEVLTAEYMMMNPLLNEVLGGSATFPEGAGNDVFLPSKITQYYPSFEFEQGESHPVAGSDINYFGTPMADFPHAGVLSDFGFLSRYPTTATNRNRARARWTLYHFLGIDIEKSSQRPTDEAALSDRNNPTLNNPACTTCHAVLDPVAGAFQNWSDFNLYKQNGTESLDRFYKYPPDGSDSLYEIGDLWYRDMRAPSLFETAITDGDYTLRELADLIVEEPAFLKASAQFWWSAIFGSHPVELPAVESDQGFADKSAAYTAQQASIEEFANILSVNMSAKDMLIEMVMSPWFSAETTTNYEFQTAQLEADLGAEQLLTPEQIAAKTMSLTGVHWRTAEAPNGTTYSYYDNLGVLLGGIDSTAVTERASLLTPTMTSILQSHAAEISCPIVVKDFALPPEERRLFLKVDETITPLSVSYSTVEVSSSSQTDWNEYTVVAEIPANGAEIKVRFANPFCDWNGQECVEQRILAVDALTLRTSNGAIQRFEASAPEIQISGEHCNVGGTDATFYGQCSMSLVLDLDAAIELEITAHLAAQQTPSTDEIATASIEVNSTANLLNATTPNAALIKQQIVDLFQTLHGKTYDVNSDRVTQTYSLFAAAFIQASEDTNTNPNCNTFIDGRFYPDLLTAQQLEESRTAAENGTWYEYDWQYLNDILGSVTADPTFTKRAWIAVIAYMLGHYDYLHE